MKVIEVTTTDNKTRYYLADETGVPVEPVLQYLKIKDKAGLAKSIDALRNHLIVNQEKTKVQRTINTYMLGVDEMNRLIHSKQ